MPGHMAAVAEEIAEDLLHRTGQGLMNGDFDLFKTCFELPQAIETMEGVRILRHEADLQQAFASVRGYFRENRVVDLVRTVVAAEFLDGETVGSTHVARLVQPGGKLFRAPYPVYSTIKRFGDAWRITSSHHVILDSRKHNEALVAWKFDDED